MNSKLCFSSPLLLYTCNPCWLFFFSRDVPFGSRLISASIKQHNCLRSVFGAVIPVSYWWQTFSQFCTWQGWVCTHWVLAKHFLLLCLPQNPQTKTEQYFDGLDNNLASAQSTNKKPLVKLACLYLLWKGFQIVFDVAPRHWSSHIMWFLFTRKKKKRLPAFRLDGGRLSFLRTAIILTPQKA